MKCHNSQEKSGAVGRETMVRENIFGDWAIWQDWHDWIVPIALALSGFAIGILVEGGLKLTIRKVLNGRAWLDPEHIIQLLKGNVSGLLTLGGLYLATFNLPIERVDVISHIRKILFVGTMLIGMRFTINFAIASIRHYTRQSEYKANLPNTSIFENLVRLAIFTVGLLVILQTLGVSILPIITALGVGGLAISLALQDTLANLFAGLQMIFARQIKVGDTIQLENGQAGVVKDIGWRTTAIKQYNGNIVILPNGKMASSIITNYAIPHPELTVTLPLTVALDSNLEQVESLVVEAAKEVGLRLYTEKYPKRKTDEFEPLVRYQSYGEAWVNLNVYLPFKNFMDAGQVRHELLKALHQRFMNEGIRLPFPQHIVHLDQALPASKA